MKVRFILMMAIVRISPVLQRMPAFRPTIYGDMSKPGDVYVLQVHMDLAGIGVSLNTPEVEVLYLLLDGVRSKVTSGKVRRTVEMCIRNIQV